MKMIALLLAAAGLAVSASTQASEELMEKSGCVSCHRIDRKLIGPAFKDVAAKYKSDKDALPYLLEKVRNGGEDVWGDMPMPPNTVEKISDADLKTLVEWILRL
ncbi:MAG: cytochrome c class [Nevskia sp.]|nr:cytochrome c class [Nevskia sp.]